MKGKDLPTAWRGRLSRFQKANCTVQQWCGQEGIPVHQFYYWQRRLQAKPKTPPVDWCPIELFSEDAANTPPETGITIRLGNAVIEVKSGFHPETLRKVLRTLEEAC